MACRDCDEKANAALAATLPDRVLSARLDGVEVKVVFWGTVTPRVHSMLKDWLGLVYDQLRPEESNDRHA